MYKVTKSEQVVSVREWADSSAVLPLTSIVKIRPILKVEYLKKYKVDIIEFHRLDNRWGRLVRQSCRNNSDLSLNFTFFFNSKCWEPLPKRAVLLSAKAGSKTLPSHWKPSLNKCFSSFSMPDTAPTVAGTAMFGQFRFTSASLQDTCRNTVEMYTEYGQKATSISVTSLT